MDMLAEAGMNFIVHTEALVTVDLADYWLRGQCDEEFEANTS